MLLNYSTLQITSKVKLKEIRSLLQLVSTVFTYCIYMYQAIKSSFRNQYIPDASVWYNILNNQFQMPNKHQLPYSSCRVHDQFSHMLSHSLKARPCIIKSYPTYLVSKVHLTITKTKKCKQTYIVFKLLQNPSCQ